MGDVTQNLRFPSGFRNGLKPVKSAFWKGLEVQDCIHTAFLCQKWTMFLGQ